MFYERSVLWFCEVVNFFSLCMRKFVNRCWTGRNSVTPQIRVTKDSPTPLIISSSRSVELRRTTLGLGINSSSRTGGVRNSICISVDGGNYMYSPSTTPFLKACTYGRFVLPGNIMNGEVKLGSRKPHVRQDIIELPAGALVVAVVSVVQSDAIYT